MEQEATLEQEVEARLALLRDDPARYAPYDLNNDGVLDDAELDRVRSILAAEIRRERALERSPDAFEQEGFVLQGRYAFDRPLGAGGQGETFLATDLEGGGDVVVKRLRLAHLDNWKAIELFEREGQVLRQLEHPDIPTYLGAFHESGDTGDRFYLVQEYVPGSTLGEMIAQKARFSEDEVIAFLTHVLEILEYLHRQNPPVIHRDIKPSNLIQREDGAWALIDFGAIQAVLTTASMVGSTIVGTSGYMAPEQFMGRSVAATDLYALGTTAVHMLSHVHPGEMPLSHMKLQYHERVQISGPLVAFLDRMIEPMTEMRFEDARQALDALGSLGTELIVAPSQEIEIPQRPLPPTKISPEERVPVTLGLALLGLFIALAVFATFFSMTSSTEVTVSSGKSNASVPSRGLISEIYVEPPDTKEEKDLPWRLQSEHKGRVRFRGIPIQLFDGSDLPAGSLKITRARVSHSYKNKYSVGLQLHNVGDQAIDSLEIRAHAVMLDRALASTPKVDAILNFKPWLHPGERSHMDFTVEVPTGTTSIQLIPAKVVREKRLPPVDTEVPFHWAAKKPEGVELRIRRRTEPSDPTRSKYDHEMLVIVEHVAGLPIELLKLEKRAFDAQNNLVGKTDAYINSHNDPYFLQGESLSGRLNTSNGKQTARFEISVVDVKLAKPYSLLQAP